jgi:hypothetical protein
MGPALQRQEQVVRHQGLLRLAGDEKVQDPRAREAGQVPQLRAVPRVSRLAPQADGQPREVPRPHHRRAVRDGREDGAALLGVHGHVEAGGGHGRPPAPRDRQPAGLSRRGGPVLPDARPPDAHALRRRVATHQSRRGPRQLAHRDDVRHRRADCRPARARQRAIAARPRAPAQRREHGHRRGARSDHHRRRRLSRGARARRWRVRGRGDSFGTFAEFLGGPRRSPPNPRNPRNSEEPEEPSSALSTPARTT